jgi:hypothetical protein
MASTLPTLNYTTPEEFVNYYYEKLKTDLQVYDLQISKVGFVGFYLNLLGYTHFDLKQYYDSLFKEAFVGTSQTEESQYLQASTYGYIPTFSTSATTSVSIPFDATIPQKTEGTEFVTCTITPRSATNLLVFDYGGDFGAQVWRGSPVSLFFSKVQ